MKIGPRYKKARYLGVPVFRKTQTQKYALRSERTKKTKRSRSRAKSEYGRQLLEKQKARYSYGVPGTQFANYVKKALLASGDHGKYLLHTLESRLDNVVLRAGFAPSRSAARQMVSHGHIRVNEKNVTIPSYEVHLGDVLSVRPGSRSKKIFSILDESLKTIVTPAWIAVEPEKKEIRVIGEPSGDISELLFDIRSVLEFYTR